MNSFFAMMSRMKYIDRWALMRNSRQENLSEHSLEVSMIAHALAVIGNTCLGKELDAQKAAVFGMYHDATEIITGDMPTPVKYYNSRIKDSYKDIEHQASRTLLSMLPERMQDAYLEIFEKKEEDAYLWKLVKAADKLSAYLKCLEELRSGNSEFVQAEKTIREALLQKQMRAVGYFFEHFIPAFSLTLDELETLDNR